MEKRATREQIGRIMSMLVGGQITFEHAQFIIDGGSSRSLENERLLYWEERVPGKGEIILGALNRFYFWEPRLMPAMPNLDEIARKAIFWREFCGVKTYSLKYPSYSRASIYDSLWGHFGDLIKEWQEFEVRNEKPSLQHSVQVALCPVYKPFLNSLGQEPKRRTSFAMNGAWIDISEGQWNSFFAAVYFMCGFLAVDKPEESAKFNSLLYLWLDGNYPIGFDEDGKLLVLVAD